MGFIFLYNLVNKKDTEMTPIFIIFNRKDRKDLRKVRKEELK